MRMQTITQSYQILDSLLYIKMKPIAEAFEDDPNWQLGQPFPENNREVSVVKPGKKLHKKARAAPYAH